ncbi:MAG: UvrD-helicase domain-containing protein [Candidatus Hodarchaeales archaeon]
MPIVNQVILGTILMALVAILYRYQQKQSIINREKKKQEILENIASLKGEIYNSIFEYETLLNSNKYISKIEYPIWYKKWKHLEPIIKKYLNLEIVSETESEIENLHTIFSNGETEITQHNKRFIENELEKNKVFFDNIEDHPLTENQRKTIVVDEKNNLVVAGAGTGKTSTIIGKAGYLLKNNQVKADELLLIAFAKKAKDEMYERGREKINLDLNVHTFHSLGLSIIGQVEGKIPFLSDLSTDRLKLSNSILNYIEKRSKNREFLTKVNNYFTFHKTPYRSEFEFNTKAIT